MSDRIRRSGNVVELRTRAGYQPDYAALARNRIMMARTAAGLSPGEFAAVLSSLVGRTFTAEHVTSWETDITPPGDVLLAAMSVGPSPSSRLGVRSHKFVAAYVGPDAARRLSERPEMTPSPVHGMECCTASIEHGPGRCDMHVWPYGSVIIHVVEDLELPDIASLALWRFQSYEENLAWATETLRNLTGDGQAAASYILSAYWVHTPVWAGRILDSALRIICSPRVLLDRELDDMKARRDSAARAERELLAEGYGHGEMRSFGLRGVSAGYASWSGAVYHPFDAGRALAEEEISSFELAVQAIWVYCAYISEQIEAGTDPVIGEGYGCSFLRGARSRLLNPRPQETGQHRSMREAIVETSGLPAQLTLAMDALKEARGR